MRGNGVRRLGRHVAGGACIGLGVFAALAESRGARQAHPVAAMKGSRIGGRRMRTANQIPLDRVLDLLLDVVCVVDAEGRFVSISAACERVFGYTREEMLGRNMVDFVHPGDRERTLEAAAGIMRDGPLPHFENRYLRKDGTIAHVMWSARWSASDGIRLAVARDVTALRHADRMQSALYRISEAAHTAAGLPGLYRDIHAIIGDLLPVDSFLVALYDESRDMLSFPYVAGEQERGHAPHPLRPGTPIEWVIRSGQGLLAITGRNGAAAAPEPAPGRADADWLGVPLISQQGTIGALVVQSLRADAHYTEEHKDLLQFVSTQVATAIERKRADIRLHHLALHDALTGLPNRALFHDRFDIALQRAVRYGERLALLYVDLNDFKKVNDAFGHETGDLLLCEAARRLVRCVRGSDTVARMGGDEFTVLLTNIRATDAASLVENKVRAAIDAPFELEGATVTISASIGAAVYPDHGTGEDELLRHADADMYAAKLSGGNL